MKLMKYITGCSAALLLLAACSKEEGPSVDDYFLNYEIPEIPVTEDYQVGIFYYLSLIHISEPTRLGMISYAVFCLKKKKYDV